MSEEEEYRQVYDFIANHSYPTGFSKNQKRVLRRKCQERFCVRRGLLYYACDDQNWRQVARSVEDNTVLYITMQHCFICGTKANGVCLNSGLFTT